MLSLRHNFIFVHVPKTGGSAIQSVLVRYSEATIVLERPHHDGIEQFEVEHKVGCRVLRKHNRIGSYRAAVGEDFFIRAFRFAVTRNPFERLVSLYFYRHVKFAKPDEAPPEVEFNENEFVKLIKLNPPLEYWVSGDDTSDGLRSQVGFFLRFDRLQADFDYTMKWIGLPPVELPVRNRSPHGPFADYYTPRTRKLVAAKHRLEIETFEYECI